LTPLIKFFESVTG